MWAAGTVGPSHLSVSIHTAPTFMFYAPVTLNLLSPGMFMLSLTYGPLHMLLPWHRMPFPNHLANCSVVPVSFQTPLPGGASPLPTPSAGVATVQTCPCAHTGPGRPDTVEWGSTVVTWMTWSTFPSWSDSFWNVLCWHESAPWRNWKTSSRD